MTRLSVVIPTVAGRERHLDQSVKSIVATTTGLDLQLLIYADRPTCGVAWREGARDALGDYVLFSADDLELLPGWLEPAVACVERGLLPAVTLVMPDGEIGLTGPDGEETDFPRVPFLRREWLARLGPMLPIHYCTDEYVGHRGREVGLETVWAEGFACVHYAVPEGRRGPWEIQLAYDRIEYGRYLSGELVP